MFQSHQQTCGKSPRAGICGRVDLPRHGDQVKVAAQLHFDFHFAADGTPLFAASAEFEQPSGEITRRLLALKHDRSSGAIALVTTHLGE
ncbi:hypothetical protein [Nocardioides plantarum]|uniref:hypothetical protein n=1 Tax=Nocardioides plantarum TaxID=29299 RepID=UPI00111F8EFF|nr:hypothetical protein [Nocardioides plantarum]